MFQAARQAVNILNILHVFKYRLNIFLTPIKKICNLLEYNKTLLCNLLEYNKTLLCNLLEYNKTLLCHLLEYNKTLLCHLLEYNKTLDTAVPFTRV